MWSWILSDETYTELYHQYYAEFLNTVDIVGIIDNAYELITPYVEKDPTAFYTAEEFELGVETLREFCTLRAESITLQLENGETTDTMNYVDASGLTLSDMGSMGGRGDFGGGMPDFSGNGSQSGRWDRNTERTSDQESDSTVQTLSGSVPSDLPEGFENGGFNGQMPDMGNLPEGVDPSQMPNGFGGTFPGQSSGEMGSSGQGSRPSVGGMQMPEGSFPSGTGAAGELPEELTGWIWIGVSCLILGVGLIIAKKYRY